MGSTLSGIRDGFQNRCKKSDSKISEEAAGTVQERERLEVMKTFERKYADYSFICGIDEAGRGPLAGPVVAGAVILPKDCEILYLNDSKNCLLQREKSCMMRLWRKRL